VRPQESNGGWYGEHRDAVDVDDVDIGQPTCEVSDDDPRMPGPRSLLAQEVDRFVSVETLKTMQSRRCAM
jgi:hypothetical protein